MVLLVGFDLAKQRAHFVAEKNMTVDSGRLSLRIFIAALVCGVVLYGAGTAFAQSGADSNPRTGAAPSLATPLDSADDILPDLSDELPEININPLVAKSPKPVYFPGEEEQMRKAKQSEAKRRAAPKDGEMILQAPEDMAPARSKSKNSDAAKDLVEHVEGTPTESAILEPQAAWLVGASTPNKLAGGDQTGCLALNQFSNGFIVGVHGREGRIAGLTVDTRQTAFEEGRVYPVGLSLANDSYAVMGLASDAGTLAIDLEDIPDFRMRVARVGAMRIMIGKTSVFFSTAGLPEGLERLGKCMEERRTKTMKVENSPSGLDGLPASISANAEGAGGEPADIKPMEITRSGKRVPIALAVTELIPGGYRFVVERGIDPMLRISWDKGPLWVDVLQTAMAEHNLYVYINGRVVRISRDAQDPHAQSQDTINTYSASAQGEAAEPDDAGDDRSEAGYTVARLWEADKDESLQDVLHAWAADAGVKLVLELDSEFVLSEHFSYDGTFQEAVNVLMSRFSDEPNQPMTRFSGGSPKRAESGAEPAQMNDQMNDGDADAPRMGLESPDAAIIGDKRSKIQSLGYLPSKNYVAKPEGFEQTSRVWMGLEGASLRDILEKWCIDAGVELLWMPAQMFELKESVKMSGGFTDAVAGVLSQFANDALKPTAQLNNDPETGRRALIVRAAGDSGGDVIPGPAPEKPKK